eukprot:tig00000478_g1278.t1
MSHAAAAAVPAVEGHGTGHSFVSASLAEYCLQYGTFAVVSFASSRFAILFPKIKLPLISGYLIAGIIVGPFVLNIVEKSALPHLGFITQFALAFISFSAGAELYLPELRELFKQIIWITGLIGVFTYIISTFVVMGLSSGGLLPSMVGQSTSCIFGVSLVVASIMVARSPASAIAIVKELRAKGPFTSALLGVTVVCDVVVLILFAVSIEVGRTSCYPGKSFNIIALCVLVLELALAVGIGYCVGKLLIFYLWIPRVPAEFLILPTGFILFLISNAITNYTEEHFSYEINLEPLLICIVGGYIATNQSLNRNKFLMLISKSGPYIFIPFFTLTGAALDLGVMFKSIAFACILFAVRMICIFFGSFLGGVMAKSPKSHNLHMWMTMLTQAGVSLGLALKVATAFKGFGDSLATSVIAVVVINQLVGPVLCKVGIKRVGEARSLAEAALDMVGEGRAGVINRVLILGAEPDAFPLAVRLLRDHYHVVVVDFDQEKLDRMTERLTAADKYMREKSLLRAKREEHGGHGGHGEHGAPAPAAKKEADVEAAGAGEKKEAAYRGAVVHELIGGKFEARQLGVLEGGDLERVGVLVESATLDLDRHNTVAAIACFENDRLNYMACKHIVHQLKLGRVCCRLTNAEWRETLVALGVYPIYNLSLCAHYAFQTLFTAPHQKFDFLFLPVSAQAVGSVIELFEHDFFLAGLSPEQRDAFAAQHPGPYESGLIARPSEAAAAAAAANAQAGIGRLLAGGDGMKEHERSEFLDHLCMREEDGARIEAEEKRVLELLASGSSLSSLRAEAPRPVPPGSVVPSDAPRAGPGGGGGVPLPPLPPRGNS